ncbi:glycosyltransferase [Skermanella rosea]|uniref:glycosyltransferase family 2 protein n=1 Tax=Skermanella rosea TaxID=1817965 RepID=UPI001934A7E2|nr:glycosyltransferase [Skermanella rosea]UEM05094.1 glycosyltransferase [Skermanella rosea]
MSPERNQNPVRPSAPLVSVVTGYYNRGPLVRRTVDSILGQSFRDFELIAFNDCSKDDTGRQLDAYDDPRLTVIHHERNTGFTRGIMNAIARSRGRYVAVQGSGDASAPDRLARQVEMFERNPDVVAVGCHYRNIVEGSGMVRVRTPSADGLTVEKLRKSNIFSHGEVMFRRDAYERAGGYRSEFTFSQDYDLWLRLIGQGRFAVVPEVLYDRYVQFDGVSFEPAKLSRQVRFTQLAVQLSHLSPALQEERLTELKAHGIDTMVALREQSIQAQIFKAASKLMLFGNAAQAHQLAAKHLSSRRFKAAYLILSSLAGKPMDRVTRPLLDRILTIERRAPKAIP